MMPLSLCFVWWSTILLNFINIKEKKKNEEEQLFG